jgi:ATP-dependent DNA ligase
MGDYAPMKAVRIDMPFSDPEWAFERKLDGIRCGALRRARQALRDGKLRHPRYQGLRDDKLAREVVREEPSP